MEDFRDYRFPSFTKKAWCAYFVGCRGKLHDGPAPPLLHVPAPPLTTEPQRAALAQRCPTDVPCRCRALREEQLVALPFCELKNEPSFQ